MPWSVDKANRLNPTNGIVLNPLHDRAFELGYLTITPEFYIIVSPILLNKAHNNFDLIQKYNNHKMILPNRFLPYKDFLKYHNDERFLRN